MQHGDRIDLSRNGNTSFPDAIMVAQIGRQDRAKVQNKIAASCVSKESYHFCYRSGDCFPTAGAA